jgi:ribosomal protein L21E
LINSTMEKITLRILKFKLFPFALLLIVCLSAVPGNAFSRRHFVRPAQKRDKVIATRNVTGTLKGFEVGDYVHAVINLAKGKENSYFIGSPGLDYFLALHKGESLALTYQIVDSYIEEAGGVQRIERLSGARAGNLTYAAWWKKMRAKYSFNQLDKMYSGMVEKLRLNP